jgi:phosphoserine aminotransferase
MQMKKHNFYAGPAILPKEVLAQAASSIKDFADMGLSILEISHRSKPFEAVMDEARNLIIELMELDEEYTVLFLSGGASSQFYMVPMNILNQQEKAYYVNTGVWASGAIREAKLFGQIEVLASSEEEQFTAIPKNYQVPSDGAYLHITSNNTIYGSQYHWWPHSPIPVVCDMSSDILSRKLDFKKFDLIYAGAQKNLGPAGVTIVIIKKSLMGRSQRKMPSMLDYRTHMDKGSMYNTPPVFSIYVTLLTLRWIKNLGLTALQNRNRKKAETLYAEIDRNSFFYGTVKNEDRSWMNVVFRTHKPEHETPFLELCKAAGCVGLAGHRSVGGFRASLYNALEQESVDVLVGVMQEFEKQHG